MTKRKKELEEEEMSFMDELKNIFAMLGFLLMMKELFQS